MPSIKIKISGLFTFAIMILFGFCSHQLSGQTIELLEQETQTNEELSTTEKVKLDSLFMVIRNADSDTSIINLLLETGGVFYGVAPSLDSACNQLVIRLCSEAIPKALSAKEQIFLKGKMGLAQHYLGMHLCDIGQYSEAKQLMYSSIGIFDEINDQAELANAYSDLAYIFEWLNDLENAIKYYEKAYLLRSNSGIRSIYTAITANNLGKNYELQGQIKKAIDVLNEGIKVSYEVGDLSEVGLLHIQLSHCYEKVDEFEQAFSHLDKAYQVANKQGDTYTIGWVFTNKGVLYDDLNQDDSTLKYYLKGLEILKEYGASNEVAGAFENVGIAYLNFPKIDSAYFYFSQADSLYRKSDDHDGMHTIQMNYGDLELLKKNFQKAISIFSHELKYSLKTKNIDYQYICYDRLYDAYKALGKHQMALQMHEAYWGLKSKSKSIDNKKTLWKYQYQSEYEAQAREDSLRHQQALVLASLKLKNTQQKNTIIITIVVALLLVAIAIILLIRSQTQKKLQELDIKTKEETLKAMLRGQEKERTRISKELHDGVGAELVSANLKLSNNKNSEAQSIIKNTLQNVRSISHRLIPPRIEMQSIEQSISSYINSIKKSVPFTIHFQAIGNFTPLSSEQKTSLYRIVQEGLSNIIKHANACEVNIQLTEESKEVTLMIEDDGKGFVQTQSNSGIGLENMKSRTANMNGEININSHPNQGTTILISLQL